MFEILMHTGMLNIACTKIHKEVQIKLHRRVLEERKKKQQQKKPNTKPKHTTTWRHVKTEKTLNKTKHQDRSEERKYLHFGRRALLKFRKANQWEVR